VETYPISLALFDFIPTLAFLTGAYFLVRIGMLCRGKPCGRMVMAGGLLVFLGGFFKATWKLLYTTGTADIQWMSQGQFIFSSIGFLGVFMAVLYMVRTKEKAAPGSTVFAMAAWKIPFLFVMTVTSLGAEGILAYMAFKRKVPLAAAGFIVGVLGLLAMGALASAEQSLTMQWIEEGINTLGQLGFMTGCILLYQDFKAAGCETPAGD
jgi:hypothetical protein